MTDEQWRQQWLALHERMARQEERLALTTQMIEQQLWAIMARLDKYDQAQSQDRALGLAAILKIMLAICLPLLVLLMTGDKKAALNAARLIGG